MNVENSIFNKTTLRRGFGNIKRYSRLSTYDFSPSIVESKGLKRTSLFLQSYPLESLGMGVNLALTNLTLIERGEALKNDIYSIFE